MTLPTCFDWREQIMTTRLFLTIALLFALITASLPVPVFAGEQHECEHGTTIESLQECVVHAADMGHIVNQGVVKSLLAMLDAAQAALDRGQTHVAVNILHAVIQEIEAQAGKHIDSDHAAHLVSHATHVIEALSP
jgi:hypothetical protein